MTSVKLWLGWKPTAFDHGDAAELQLRGAVHHPLEQEINWITSRQSKTKFNHMTTKVVGLPVVIYRPAAPGDFW